MRRRAGADPFGCLDNDPPLLFALAGRIAEAQIDLARVRQARLALTADALKHPVYEKQLTLRLELRILKRYLRVYGPLTPFSPQDAKRLMPDPVEGPHRLAIVIAKLARPLVAIDR